MTFTQQDERIRERMQALTAAGSKPCPGDGERGCLVFIPERRKRCRFCATTIGLRRIDRAATPQIVAGEEELGLQRKCVGCQQWWPFTNEFFPFWTNHRRGTIWQSRTCRACRSRPRELSTAFPHSPPTRPISRAHFVDEPQRVAITPPTMVGALPGIPTKEGGAPVTLLRAAR